jgi:uncharacterized protein (DUF58 family)
MLCEDAHPSRRKTSERKRTIVRSRATSATHDSPHNAMAITTDFLRELDRFEILLKKRVNAQYQGNRETTNTGSGLTFKDYKEYTFGDDFRQIDWKIYSRSDKYYVRRYEEERNLTIHIIVDASASMNFGKPVTKFEYAAQVGLGFAYIALKNNERFEFSTFAEELHPFKPKKGNAHLISIVNRLSELSITGQSAFAKSLESYRKLITSKSVIVIISDFLYPITEIENTLARFKNQEVIAVQVLDPLEQSFAVEGDLILTDAETDKKMRTFVTRRVQQDYRAQMDEHAAKIHEITQAMNYSFHTVTTERPVFDTIYEAVLRQER